MCPIDGRLPLATHDVVTTVGNEVRTHTELRTAGADWPMKRMHAASGQTAGPTPLVALGGRARGPKRNRGSEGLPWGCKEARSGLDLGPAFAPLILRRAACAKGTHALLATTGACAHADRMAIDQIVDAIKQVQDLIEDNKEGLKNGEYVDLCNSMQSVYNCARAIKKAGTPNAVDDTSDEDDGEGEEEEVQIVHTPRGPYYVSADGSMRRVVYPEVPDEEDEEEDEEEEEEEEESVERTEADMGVNELSELWGCHFDNGSDRAVMDLEGLIYELVEEDEAKRVCAAARVLNRAARDIKPDDPADAEKLLQWKEQLVEERAIRACAELLEGVDNRVFHNENHDEHWLYSIICDEILELLLCLGDGDALFRTKMRRNGVLKGVKAYAKRRPNHREAQELLHELS